MSAPRCARCDDPAWRGWEHDRANYAVPHWREAMLRAHYPYRCGYDRWAVERGQMIEEEEGDRCL